ERNYPGWESRMLHVKHSAPGWMCSAQDRGTNTRLPPAAPAPPPLHHDSRAARDVAIAVSPRRIVIPRRIAPARRGAIVGDPGLVVIGRRRRSVVDGWCVVNGRRRVIGRRWSIVGSGAVGPIAVVTIAE